MEQHTQRRSARRSAPGRRLCALVVALAAGLLLLLGGGVASAGALRVAAPVFGPLATACSNAYFDGDIRLGPAQLEQIGPVGPILAGYNRLAGLSAAQFIATYWDPTASGGAGGWRFPPRNGYLLIGGLPVEYHATLAPGTPIDRFGSEFGAFLAPLDTPYAERALPPMSLDNFDPLFTCNYHVYRVTKAFMVDEGLIAPGFGQPGHGIQIQLDSTLVPGAPTRLNVLWLINNGYLARAN